MALKLIPFYGSLVGQRLNSPGDPKQKKASHSHVLVFGAIEAHSMGEKGVCIASNKTIAEETGLSISRVASILSEIANAMWVHVETDEKNRRQYIQPLLILAKSGNPPLPHVATPLASSGNISNSNIKQKEIEHSSKLRSDDLPASSSAGDGDMGSAERAAHLRKIFDALVGILQPGQTILYTDKRKSHLNARLKNFKPSQLVEAAKNLMQDPWNTGQNPQGKKYADFDFLTRSDEQVEKWLSAKPVKKHKSVF